MKTVFIEIEHPFNWGKFMIGRFDEEEMSRKSGVGMEKHQLWVCPMYLPFLTWLYNQDLTDLDKLPKVVQFTDEDAEGAMAGYRRSGPGEEEREELKKQTTKRKKK